MKLKKIELRFRAITTSFGEGLLRFFKNDFFKDISVQLLLIFSGIFLVFSWIVSLYFFEQSDYLVPLRFSSFIGFFELGQWYRLYELTFFYSVIVFINFFLATVIYKKDKFLSYIFLASNLFISLIVLMLIYNFGKALN